MTIFHVIKYPYDDRTIAPDNIWNKYIGKVEHNRRYGDEVILYEATLTKLWQQTLMELENSDDDFSCN